MSSTTVLDAREVRAAYQAGLTLWARPLPGGEVKALQGRLETCMFGLLPQVEELAVRMSGEARATAVVVVASTSALVEQGVMEADVSTAYIEDLAVECRALLALCEQPGPLVEPWGVDEVAAAGRCRVCRECWRPISAGQRWVARRPGVSGRGGGLLHAGCAPTP